MDKQDTMYYKRLKALQIDHKPNKWEARHRYNWKKEWGPFIKYDADWDGSYLLELIIYKLEKMYIGLDVYSDEVREDLNKRLETLKKTIDLGKKIQTYNYDAEYTNWAKIHCAHVILIYKRGSRDDKDILHRIVHWYDPEQDEKEDIYLDRYFGNQEVHKWAKENGYTMADLSIAYTGEWDDVKNYKIWKQKVKEAAKVEQKDIDEFFKLIARNYRGWWW